MPNENIHKAERKILNYNSLDTYVPNTVTITWLNSLKEKAEKGVSGKSGAFFQKSI